MCYSRVDTGTDHKSLQPHPDPGPVRSYARYTPKTKWLEEGLEDVAVHIRSSEIQPVSVSTTLSELTQLQSVSLWPVSMLACSKLSAQFSPAVTC